MAQKGALAIAMPWPKAERVGRSDGGVGGHWRLGDGVVYAIATEALKHQEKGRRGGGKVEDDNAIDSENKTKRENRE
jgi:hypothetical protein